MSEVASIVSSVARARARGARVAPDPSGPHPASRRGGRGDRILPRRKMMRSRAAPSRGSSSRRRPPAASVAADNDALVGGSGRVGDGPPGETRRRLPRGRAERRRTTVDARLGKKRKKRVNGPSRVRRPPMTERSATTTTATTTRIRRAREGDRFFSSRHRRENLQKSRKRAARVLASRRGHRRAPARALTEVRGGGVRLGAQPSRNARENGEVTKKTHSGGPRRGRPPAWRSRRSAACGRRNYGVTVSTSGPRVAARRVVAEQGRASDRGRFGERRETRRRGEDAVNLRFSKTEAIGVCAVRSVRRRVVLRPGVRRVGRRPRVPQTVRGCAVFVRAARDGRRNSFGVRSQAVTPPRVFDRSLKIVGFSTSVGVGNEVGVKR